ncbi:MAG: ATPase, partial [Thermoprotei archaeon]
LKDLVGRGVSDLARVSRRPPCSVCGIVKRYLINVASIELGVDAVALGHNADDIIAYTFKSFMLQDLESIPKLGPKTESIERLAVGRVRPLYEVYERETLIYALVNRVPFVQDRCPLMPRKSLEFKIKEIFTDLEYSMPGVKLSYLKNLAKRLSDYPKPDIPVRSCSVCGLISSESVCSFCKLTEKVVGKALGREVRNGLRSLITNLT